jgi:hypothetical protein
MNALWIVGSGVCWWRANSLGRFTTPVFIVVLTSAGAVGSCAHTSAALTRFREPIRRLVKTPARFHPPANSPANLLLIIEGIRCRMLGGLIGYSFDQQMHEQIDCKEDRMFDCRKAIYDPASLSPINSMQIWGACHLAR